MIPETDKVCQFVLRYMSILKVASSMVILVPRETILGFGQSLSCKQ